MKLKGRIFQTLEEIQAESQAVLNTLRENDFQECFKNWQRRWDRCQASEGDYFKGDAGPEAYWLPLVQDHCDKAHHKTDIRLHK